MRQRRLLSPPNLVLLSFALVIAVGILMLSLPMATSKEPLTGIDALFLSTSAVCVTGLTPIDPGSTLSLFGQVVLLLLIQVGGLGYMSISSFAALILYHRLTFVQRAVLELSHGELIETRKLLCYIIGFTLLAELIGAVLLFIAFGRYELPPLTRFWFAIFHSVSAFCNAGLNVFGLVGKERGWSESLCPFADDALIILTAAPLIMLGGLGFPVIVEISDFVRRKRKRWSLHARTVFFINGLLWFGGMALIWLFEMNNPRTLAAQPLPIQGMSAFFQSVTSRTAGFSSVPTGELTAATLWLLALWMFIGASPGGTGGGIKTATIGILAAATFAGMRGQEQVNLFRRSISPERVAKAVTFALLATQIVGITVFLLCLTEKALLSRDIPHGFLGLLFEAVSACATVGLSTGITPLLSSWGKLILIVTMFLGRVGLLTVMIALLGGRTELIRYPREEILVG